MAEITIIKAGTIQQAKKTSDKNTLINVDLRQTYKHGTAEKIILNDVEQIIYDYFVEKLEQDNYRNTLNEFQLNISKICLKFVDVKNSVKWLDAKYVFISDKNIKKALLKINLAGIDKKFNHTIKSDISKNGNCYIKSVEFDSEYIKEKQEKTLTEKQEQEKKERAEKQKKLDEVAEFKLDNTTAGAGTTAINNIMDLCNDDEKNKLLNDVLEKLFNAQDCKAIKNSLLAGDGKFNSAYLVMKSNEFKRLLKIEKEFQQLKKTTEKTTAGAGNNPAEKK